jgi:hypothetical protein
MRSILVVFTLVGSALALSCCKGNSDPPKDTKATPVATTTARPCSGMPSDKDCQACCGAGYKHTFKGAGSCACIH